MAIPIVEIFKSIEGEGVRSGRVCTFIRVAGCNCRCSYCDTMYSYDEQAATKMEVEEILEKVEELQCKTITVTGGEPLINKDVVQHLIPQLLGKGYDINVETNGSVPIDVATRGLRDKLMFTIDWKSPSSGMNSKMLVSNLLEARPCDVIKFVVGDKNDLLEMVRVYRNYNTLARHYVSPVFGKIQMEEIVEFLKDNRLHDITMQCQLHKIIWDVNKRGV